MKCKTIVSLLVISLCVTISYPAFADGSDVDVYGGWDEDTGYFKTVSDYQSSLKANSSLYQSSTTSSPSHTGKREKTTINGTTHSRAHGWTTWVGVYHYTRARMEEHFPFLEDIVLTDSGRIWGRDGTEAISPWWKFNQYVSDRARTYYGH